MVTTKKALEEEIQMLKEDLAVARRIGDIVGEKKILYRLGGLISIKEEGKPEQSAFWSKKKQKWIKYPAGPYR